MNQVSPIAFIINGLKCMEECSKTEYKNNYIQYLENAYYVCAWL